jgi:hypothetical protein
LRRIAGEQVREARLRQLGVVRHVVGDEAPLARGVALRHDHALAHRAVRPQACLDLAQLDAVAADLDLVVDAPEQLEVAVLHPAREVAGAVHARARFARERIGQEALGGELGTVVVALAHADAAEVQLAPARARGTGWWSSSST